MTVTSGPAVLPTDSSLYFWSWGTASFQSNYKGKCYLTLRIRQDKAGEENAEIEVYNNGNLSYITVEETTFTEKTIKFEIDSVNYIHFGNDYPQERNVELDWIEYVQLMHVPDTGKVILAWDANTEPDLAGYRLWWGLKSRSYDAVIDVGDTTQFTVYWLPMNVRLYFAVTAYDTASNESLFSNEVDTLIESQAEYRKGDWNQDRKISLADMIQFTARFGATIENIEYDIVFDFNEDNKISLFDMIKFTEIFGLIY